MSRPWIIIPAHNRRALTLGCLDALQANGDLDFADVVLVDDGSTDGTGAAVRAQFPRVRVLNGNGDLYWTGAIAFAMQHAETRHMEGPLFWLNDDCRPRDKAIPTLTEMLLNKPASVVGPRCVDARTGMPVATGFIGREVFAPGNAGRIQVQGLSGFCVGIGVTAWRDLGPPDALRFPHYGGDTAYSLMAARRGFPVLLTGDAVVELADHEDARTTLAGRVRPGESFAANWRRILLAKNSPCRLRTLFALQQLKYGRLLGTASGTVRAASWVVELGLHWLRRRG